jgi:tRNA dimethylallyltransferase
MSKILVICGPTATGKTATALKLATQFKGDLISADSRQIYRGMDIGTGKDIPPGFQAVISDLNFNQKNLTVYRRQRKISIWGYDLVDPDQDFSAAAYYQFAWTVIPYLWAKGRMPILVGGTGLYLKSVLTPPKTLGMPPNSKLRQSLAAMSLTDLQDQLQAVNFKRWQTMNRSDRANPRRLVRAIEISLEFSDQPIKPPSVDAFWLGLRPPLTQLDAAINRRVQKRACPKFTQEIRRLQKLYPSFSTYNAASATGYHEWISYLNHHLTRSEAIALWQRRERQYARRQITWFKSVKAIHWFDRHDPGFLADIVAQVKTWYAKSDGS